MHHVSLFEAITAASMEEIGQMTFPEGTVADIWNSMGKDEKDILLGLYEAALGYQMINPSKRNRGLWNYSQPTQREIENFTPRQVFIDARDVNPNWAGPMWELHTKHIIQFYETSSMQPLFRADGGFRRGRNLLLNVTQLGMALGAYANQEQNPAPEVPETPQVPEVPQTNPSEPAATPEQNFMIDWSQV